VLARQRVFLAHIDVPLRSADRCATTPEEIAVSIVAELIADRRRCEAALPHLGCVDALVAEEAAQQPSKK